MAVPLDPRDLPLSHWLTRFGNACARNWAAIDRTGRFIVACLGMMSLCFALLAIEADPVFCTT